MPRYTPSPSPMPERPAHVVKAVEPSFAFSQIFKALGRSYGVPDRVQVTGMHSFRFRNAMASSPVAMSVLAVED